MRNSPKSYVFLPITTIYYAVGWLVGFGPKQPTSIAEFMAIAFVAYAVLFVLFAVLIPSILQRSSQAKLAHECEYGGILGAYAYGSIVMVAFALKLGVRPLIRLAIVIVLGLALATIFTGLLIHHHVFDDHEEK